MTYINDGPRIINKLIRHTDQIYNPYRLVIELMQVNNISFYEAIEKLPLPARKKRYSLTSTTEKELSPIDYDYIKLYRAYELITYQIDHVHTKEIEWVLLQKRQYRTGVPKDFKPEQLMVADVICNDIIRNSTDNDVKKIATFLRVHQRELKIYKTLEEGCVLAKAKRRHARRHKSIAA